MKDVATSASSQLSPSAPCQNVIHVDRRNTFEASPMEQLLFRYMYTLELYMHLSDFLKKQDKIYYRKQHLRWLEYRFLQISVYFFVTRIMLLYFAEKWLVFMFTQRG